MKKLNGSEPKSLRAYLFHKGKNFQRNNNFFVSVIVSIFVSPQVIDFQYLI